ncbi:amidohydrolase [Schizophyllum commune H4-8]|uniref:Peptidase M20 dimerisation domain-containing protein n=1 Tax=Schizophyllum commune (strain H4-8 / FGSC 9210) TaxID=578458 RepID=D8Q1A9_SCHCM|nr:amidohydrolase [Schizophyllum commune H4-8]KAI5895340.1 amidohydrolase [Schizophyllum commune H4-8]
MADLSKGCFSALLPTLRRNKRKGAASPPPYSSTQVIASKEQVSGTRFVLRRTGDLRFQSGCACALDGPADFAYAPEETWWRDDKLPPYIGGLDAPAPSFVQTVNDVLDGLDSELRELSLQIHSHPELGYKERFAHDTLTTFMAKHGFTVTKHYLGLDTAWRAEYTHIGGGRVLGINAEMDALPLGHACGHNLIAMSGAGVAVAVKSALETHNLPGKIVILGTPADFSLYVAGRRRHVRAGGGGKVLLLERGAYEGMDACIMSHPTVGPPHTANVGSTNARFGFQVDYEGHSAHAAASPWEGTNALDAAFMAYAGVSALRQQMKPTYRVHGIIVGREEWTPNVIPDHATMRWNVRAPTKEEASDLAERVKNCFHGAALATGCKITIKEDIPLYLWTGDAFTEIAQQYYGLAVGTQSTSASTDFGNISQALPGLHPTYAIPAERGNHTPEFAEAAATPAAHAAAMRITKALAVFGVKFLQKEVAMKAKVCDALNRYSQRLQAHTWSQKRFT